MADYKWKPIEDLPADWTKLASSELAGLASVWREHYETIKDGKAFKQFNERLRREWAIETGIIENLYYIDCGVTRTLIEKGIEASLIPHGTTDKPAELIVPILKDQEEVVEGLFDFVGQQRQLSTSYIKQLHQALTRHQLTTTAKDSLGRTFEALLLHGEWKKLPNNPMKPDGTIHEYCPPEQVASEMDRLLELHHEHTKNQVPSEIEAAWLHHRFTQIHPFQDGNGRLARTLASLIFLRDRLFPLVVSRDDRVAYIDSLEEADNGQLQMLIRLFLSRQKRAINKALSLSEDILFDVQPLQQVISAAVEQLKEKTHVPSLSAYLEKTAFEKIESLAQNLNQQLTIVDSGYSANTAVSYKIKDYVSKRGDSIHYSGINRYDAFIKQGDTWHNPRSYDGKDSYNYQSKLANIAYKQDHQANTKAYYSWLALVIVSGTQKTEIIVALYALGAKYVGVIAASAFIKFSTQGWSSFEGYKTETENYLPISQEPFQFTETESLQDVTLRFQKWLDEILLVGLDCWRKQI